MRAAPYVRLSSLLGLGTATLGVVVLWLCGCSSTRSKSADTKPPATASVTNSTKESESKEPQDSEEIYAHYATGLIHEFNRRPKEAATEFYKAAMADPSDVTLVVEAAQRLLQHHENGRAVKLLDHAAHQPNASGLISLFLGRAYLQAGNTNAAIKASQIALKKMPSSSAPYEELAPLYLQIGDQQAALRLLQEAARKTGKDPEFTLDIAELHLAHRRLFGTNEIAFKSRVVSMLDQAASKLPNVPALSLRLAEAYASVDETEKALPRFAALYQQNPALPGLRERLTDFYLRTGNGKKAGELLEKIIRDQPLNPQAYYLLGHLAAENKEYQKASEFFRKCLLLNPENETGYFDLAAMQIAMNQPQAALTTLQPMQERKRQDFRLEYFTALAFNRLKDYSKALSHLVAAEVIANATDTNRLTAAFLFQLGACYERNQDFDQAEKYFHQCLQMNPDDVDTLNYLGYMWADRGVNLEDAQNLIEKAVKLEPKNAAFLDSLAWVLFKRRQADKALPILQQALELSPEPDATLFDHLGDIYAANHQLDKARDAWKQSLDIEPNAEVKKKWESSTPVSPQKH